MIHSWIDLSPPGEIQQMLHKNNRKEKQAKSVHYGNIHKDVNSSTLQTTAGNLSPVAPAHQHYIDK